MTSKLPIESLMQVRTNIRNLSVIAHVDHGKSTLVDSLVAAAGLMSVEDISRRVMSSDFEQEKGVTIKSSGISLGFDMKEKNLRLPDGSDEGGKFLINVIDSPGHVDFSAEVTAALRVTDGALVLVDCVEGPLVQTETVLKQALQERIRPVLVLNKLDRAFLELQLDPENIFRRLREVVERVNVTIETFQDPTLGDWKVYPEKGNVCFATGVQGWAFSIPQFARMYAQKLKISEERLTEKLWGDWFFDGEAKAWTSSYTSQSGRPLQRGFCQFVLEPIKQVFDVCYKLNSNHSNDNDAAAVPPVEKTLDKILEKLNIKLSAEERELTGKNLLKVVMRSWLPAADALLEMAVTCLPSPVAAMKYRTEVLYQGPLDDKTAESMRNCDPSGPLLVFVSKHIPTKDMTRFYSFGRVFSGTVCPGQKVFVMAADYEKGEKEGLHRTSIQRTLVMMADKAESVEMVPAGNTVALVGIDSVVSKAASITQAPESWPLVAMKYSVSPVVRCAITPKNPADIAKLVDGLRKLSIFETFVRISTASTGEHILECTGEFHLEICLKYLRDFVKGVELICSEPVVPFQETVLEESKQPCLAKSANKHNRLYCCAEPLSSSLLQDIDAGRITISSQESSSKNLAKLLTEKYGWDSAEARKIWCFGPGRSGSSSASSQPTSVVVDATKGIQDMIKIKDSVVAAFT